MGFFDRFRFAARTAQALAQADSAVAPLSPWATGGTLGELVVNDVFPNAELLPVTREVALTVPAVTKGRAYILGELSPAPLRCLDAQDAPQPLPAWVHETGVAGVTPLQRMADTLDDMVFHGAALWAVRRDDAGAPIAAAHVHRDLWRIDPGTRAIEVRPHVESNTWTVAPATGAIYIPALQDGLVRVAAATIRGALAIEKTWTSRARAPLPAMKIKERQEFGLTPAEAKNLVAEVAASRLDPDAAVIFEPREVEIEAMTLTSTDLLTEGRNATRLDIAQFLNLPAALVDATVDKASLNYETQDGRASEGRARLAFWAGPIEARLSLDDLCPPGTRMRFDLAGPTTTGTPTED